MKALQKIALFALVALFSANALYAGVKPGKKLAYSVHALKDSQKVQLIVDNESGDPIQIELLNAKHEVVYKETERHSASIAKMYNLEGLPQGTYYVHLKSDEFESETPVYVGPHESANYPFEALITGYDENRVHVAFGNAFDAVTVTFTDAEGNVLYSETSDEQHTNQFFNLESLKPGIYYVTVTCGTKEVKQSYAVIE